MAVSFDGTRISRADSNTDGGNWDKWNATQAPANEVDFVYETGGTNGYAMSNKVSSTTGGVELDTTSPTVDYSTSARTLLTLVNTTTYGLINTSVHLGSSYQIGSGTATTNVLDYYIFGSFRSYPYRGGWLMLAIDPNETAYIDLTTGTPSLTAIDYYSWRSAITGSAKAENLVMDALAYLASTGAGLTWTGSGGDFQEFVTFDYETASNRYGVVYIEPGSIVSAGGPIIVTGFLNLSDTASTQFSDTGVAAFWTDSYTGKGFNGLGIDLTHASTTIEVQDSFFKGMGRGYEKNFFDAQLDVDGTNDVVTGLTNTDLFQDLDYVTYSDEGGTSMGLTDTNSYWIRYDTTNSGWAFYTSRANAASDTSRANLNTTSGSESHSLLLATDTRPDCTFTGTGAAAGQGFTGCSFDNFRNFTLTSKAELNTCKFTRSEQITQAGGTIDGCTISTCTTETGDAFIVSAGSVGNIKNNSFTQSTKNGGHAVKCTATGTYDWTGNTDSGYTGTRGTNSTPASGSTDAMFFNDSGGLITLNVGGGGQSPSVRNGTSATTTVNNNVDLTVTVTDADGTALVGVRVAIYTDPGGTQLMNEDTVAGGIATQPYNYTSDQAISVRVRESPNTASGRYFPFYTEGTIESTGYTLDVILEEDGIAQVTT